LSENYGRHKRERTTVFTTDRSNRYHSSSVCASHGGGVLDATEITLREASEDEELLPCATCTDYYHTESGKPVLTNDADKVMSAILYEYNSSNLPMDLETEFNEHTFCWGEYLVECLSALVNEHDELYRTEDGRYDLSGVPEGYVEV
jgi:hypothetical protein